MGKSIKKEGGKTILRKYLRLILEKNIFSSMNGGMDHLEYERFSPPEDAN
jgi:hypothetical protein